MKTGEIALQNNPTNNLAKCSALPYKFKCV